MIDKILEKSGEFLEKEREDGYGEGWNDYMARLFAKECMKELMNEMTFRLNKLPMYAIRKEIGVTAPNVMITDTMPISVIGLCKDDVFKTIEEIWQKEK